MTSTTEDNKMRPMMSSSYGDSKLDKSNELNSSMSIAPTSPDEVTNKIMSNLGGTQ